MRDSTNSTTHGAANSNGPACILALAFVVRHPPRDALCAHQARRMECMGTRGIAVSERVDDNAREVGFRFWVIV